MSDRKNIPQKTIDAITTKSRRVCAMCWGLQRDGRGEKEGQVAHINGKNDDDREENLCWLCLFHHNRYDGRMRLSKNFSPSELRVYKAEVEDGVAALRLPSSSHLTTGSLDVIGVRAAALYMDGAGIRPQLEIWVQAANQGPYPCGVRSAACRWQDVLIKLDTHGKSTTPGGEKDSRPHRRAPLHPDARYLTLHSDHAVPAGDVRWWALSFSLTNTPLGSASFWNGLPSTSEGVRRLESPLLITIQPVVGPGIDLFFSDVEVFEGDLIEKRVAVRFASSPSSRRRLQVGTVEFWPDVGRRTLWE